MTNAYSVSWDSTKSANGTHALTAVARDAAGNSAVSSVVSIVVNNADATAPTVSIQAPLAGATVSGSATAITASAADNLAVAGVQFKVDGVNLGTEDVTSPYAATWNTTSVTNGTHTLTAVARDTAGNTTVSPAISIVVSNSDTVAPAVSIQSPLAGATVSGSATTVTASATDNVGVSGVQLKVDGVNIGAEDVTSPYSVTWNTTSAANGTHTLTAVARDATGNSTVSAGISVVINNADTVAPTISIQSPSAGGTVSGSALSITAIATDNVGIIGVQFKVDGVNVAAEDVTSPYSVTWNTTTAANGTHTLTAVARDAAGHTTVSTVVTVTVNNTSSLVWTVIFQASADHASSLLTGYRLEVFANGANPATATPIATRDLGKPAPQTNGDISVDAATFFNPLAPGTYQATVSAIGAGIVARGQAVSFVK
jgi:hypothetical protein